MDADRGEGGGRRSEFRLRFRNLFLDEREAVPEGCRAEEPLRLELRARGGGVGASCCGPTAVRVAPAAQAEEEGRRTAEEEASARQLEEVGSAEQVCSASPCLHPVSLLLREREEEMQREEERKRCRERRCVCVCVCECVCVCVCVFSCGG